MDLLGKVRGIKLGLFGHVERLERLTRGVCDSEVEGRRSSKRIRVRSRMRWRVYD